MKVVTFRGAQALSFIGRASDTDARVEFMLIKDLLTRMNTATWDGEGLRMVDEFDHFEDTYRVTALRLLDVKDALLAFGWIEINDLNEKNAEERFDSLMFLKITEKGQAVLAEMVEADVPSGHKFGPYLDGRTLVEGAPQA
jgi:hypothetical protein